MPAYDDYKMSQKKYLSISKGKEDKITVRSYQEKSPTKAVKIVHDITRISTATNLNSKQVAVDL